MKSFASDNYSGIHPKILAAIKDANHAHAVAYGADEHTKSAIEKFKELFGKDVSVYFVFNGTGANVLGLRAVTGSFNSIICSNSSHLHIDECGAPEFFTGAKLLTAISSNGKLRVEDVKPFLQGFGVQHHSQPKVISIAQSSELGTVYTPDEIQALAKLAHENGLLLHIDGARLANAAASLNTSLRDISFDAGADLISFGGTKNGMMLGEAVIFKDSKLSENFQYIRKQSMQLASKMRFISAQFNELLSNNLYLDNARHANTMAKLLAKNLSQFKSCTITQEVESNAVFVKLNPEHIYKLQEKYHFYIWNEAEHVIRLMCSFDTSIKDIEDFTNEFAEISTH